MDYSFKQELEKKRIHPKESESDGSSNADTISENLQQKINETFKNQYLFGQSNQEMNDFRYENESSIEDNYCNISNDFEFAEEDIYNDFAREIEEILEDKASEEEKNEIIDHLWHILQMEEKKDPTTTFIREIAKYPKLSSIFRPTPSIYQFMFINLPNSATTTAKFVSISNIIIISHMLSQLIIIFHHSNHTKYHSICQIIIQFLLKFQNKKIRNLVLRRSPKKNIKKNPKSPNHPVKKIHIIQASQQSSKNTQILLFLEFLMNLQKSAKTKTSSKPESSTSQETNTQWLHHTKRSLISTTLVLHMDLKISQILSFVSISKVKWSLYRLTQLRVQIKCRLILSNLGS